MPPLSGVVMTIRNRLRRTGFNHIRATCPVYIKQSEFLPAVRAEKIARFNRGAAVGAVMRRPAARQTMNFFRVYLRAWVAFQTLSFVSGNFVNGAAVRARDKIPFPEAEQRDKEENEPLACAGDHRHGVRDSAAGEVPALPAAEFPGVACNRKEKEHYAAS